jgi:hypothetical protein
MDRPGGERQSRGDESRKERDRAMAHRIPAPPRFGCFLREFQP